MRDSAQPPPDAKPGRETAPSAPTCSADKAKFDAFVADLTTQALGEGVTGASVSVVCGGSIWSAGIGMTAKAGGAPVDGHTRFNIGSTQKPLTAALAMRLVEEGVLSLGDPASKWVPGINTEKPYSTGVTFAELLSHVSGYPAVPPNSDMATQLAAFFTDQASVLLWSPPGVVFNYSDDGFDLAGLMMQNAAGKPFGDLVQEKVFGPAGMVDASMDPKVIEKGGNYAFGYSSYYGETGVTPSQAVFPSEAPDTGAFTSAEDLAHFAQTLMRGGGAMLKPSSVARMTSPKTATDDPSEGTYGYGILNIDRGGTAEWEHNGQNTGYVSDLSMFPAFGFATAILLDDDSAENPAAYAGAFETFLGRKLPPPPGDTFDAADLPDYVGTYDSVTLGTITVAQNAGDLEITIGGKTGKMTPAWKDTFMFLYHPWGGQLELNFWRISGKVTYAVTRAGVGARE